MGKRVKYLCLGVMAINGYVLATTCRKYKRIEAGLNRKIWMSQQTIMPSDAPKGSQHWGIAFSDVIIDLREADFETDLGLELNLDYSRVILRLPSFVNLLIDGDAKCSRINVYEVGENDPSALKRVELKIAYHLTASSLEIEVFS